MEVGVDGLITCVVKLPSVKGYLKGIDESSFKYVIEVHFLKYVFLL